MMRRRQHPSPDEVVRFRHLRHDLGAEIAVHEAAADPHPGYILESLLDAKGDLVVASADNTPGRLAVGSNGSYPRAASGASVGIEWQKNNMAASAAPAVGDDVDDGYSVGSIWLDTTNDKGYICLDATAGAAVWKETTAAAGGISSGTSNPAQPAFGNNVPFLRTDLGIIIYYDGTRWLSVQQYTLQLIPYASLPSSAMSVSTALKALASPPFGSSYDFWMEKLHIGGAVLTTNDATKYWQFDFESDDAATGTPTVIAQPDTKTWTANNNSILETTINALLGTSTRIVYIDCVKVSTPGNCHLYDAKIIGRKVVT